MAKMIQIRHVPDALHRRLKARAAVAGMSLSDYLREELARISDQLSYQELHDRLAALPARLVHESPVDAVRSERDAR